MRDDAQRRARGILLWLLLGGCAGAPHPVQDGAAGPDGPAAPDEDSPFEQQARAQLRRDYDAMVDSPGLGQQLEDLRRFEVEGALPEPPWDVARVAAMTHDAQRYRLPCLERFEPRREQLPRRLRAKSPQIACGLILRYEQLAPRLLVAQETRRASQLAQQGTRGVEALSGGQGSATFLEQLAQLEREAADAHTLAQARFAALGQPIPAPLEAAYEPLRQLPERRWLAMQEATSVDRGQAMIRAAGQAKPASALEGALKARTAAEQPSWRLIAYEAPRCQDSAGQEDSRPCPGRLMVRVPDEPGCRIYTFHSHKNKQGPIIIKGHLGGTLLSDKIIKFVYSSC